jgi:hypothetical protein
VAFGGGGEAQAAAWIMQTVSRGQLIAVQLTLWTSPTEATFQFGDSPPDATDDTGLAVWNGTRREGLVTLTVSKSGYTDRAKVLRVQRVKNEAIVKLEESITLDRRQ